jgi:hypothetical protein
MSTAAVAESLRLRHRSRWHIGVNFPMAARAQAGGSFV